MAGGRRARIVGDVRDYPYAEVRAKHGRAIWWLLATVAVAVVSAGRSIGRLLPSVVLQDELVRDGSFEPICLDALGAEL